MNRCKKCDKEFIPVKGLVQYCSMKCRQGKQWTEEDKEKKSKAAKNSDEVKHAAKIKSAKSLVQYICNNCGNNFIDKRIHAGRKTHCKDCRKNTKRVKEGVSLLDFSPRTVTKILKKAKIPCQNCGYNKASRDVHHIHQKKDGGTDENNNLVVLCPNCHREAHECYISKEFLKTKTIDIIFPNYKDYYHKE